MGAGQSTTSQTQSSHALHVLRVTPSSPASQTSIEPFFDFIVGFNDRDSFSSHNELDATELDRIVEEHEEHVLNLLVWSSKTRKTRVVPIIPSRGWALAQQAAVHIEDSGPSPQPSLLGLSMRMCEFESAADNVWHVLEVIEGSPAESAGLVPYGDWIIGWSGGVLTAENDFYEVVEAHVDKPLRVYVYSYDFDNLREVVLVPNRHWGGEGLLGCVFGFGYLHRIPSQPMDHGVGNASPQLQPNEFENQQVFIPADVTQHVIGHRVSEDRGRLSIHEQSTIAHPRPTRFNDKSRQTVSGEPRNTSTSRSGTPRHSTFTSASSQTQPANRSLGSPLNGFGAINIYSVTAFGRPQVHAGTPVKYHDDDDDDDNMSDGTVSVSGTEATDFGSLTSVE
ncbi:GRASP55/65 PDZ-like domain-containing protein [Phlebopus sp. FC_14]|nr:GRASP55/65 PDZ-like domain-containing protein [Phlebopus sp. FC_14]